MRPTVVAPGLSASDGALELVPIPLAIACCIGERLAWEVSNRAFVRAALQDEPGLADAALAFLRSDEIRRECDWQAGAAVERRHYRVVLTRMTHRVDPACMVSFVDQTAEVRTEDTLRREMATDSLTGLPNRGGFTDSLEAMIAQGTDRWAVLMIDLERFSRFNACLGSLAGDELLITVARRMKGGH